MQDNTSVFNLNTVLNHINNTYSISFTGTNYEKYKSIMQTMYKTNPKLFINNKKLSFIPYNDWKFSKQPVSRFISRTEYERTPCCNFYTVKTDECLRNILDSLPTDICSLICIELNKIYFNSSLDPVGARTLIKKINLQNKIKISKEILKSIKVIKTWIIKYKN